MHPIALGILDDRSRLACHVQWYLSETTETFVHGLSQAFQKRALPRSFMTDNGAAMLAAETQEGLRRLGVLHQTTLPYSPYQNAKQESFWGQLEGRCVAMLEGCRDLSLALLNQTTLDRARNADGRRRRLPASETTQAAATPTGEIAPLLKQLLSDYAATGLPPSYVPLDPFDKLRAKDPEEENS